MNQEEILRAIARRVSVPGAIEDPPLPLPGDAWERRLLVALADHVPRQLWLARMVEEHLAPGPPRFGDDRGFGDRDDLPQQGAVPGLPRWSYCFHGFGCCLTHEDGTAIDVDVDERGADGIDPYFFAAYLDSLPSPTGLEALLRRPPPLDRAWMTDLSRLRTMGLLETQHRFRLTAMGSWWVAALGPALREMARAAPARRRHLALALGDFEIAAAAGEGPLPAAFLAQKDAAFAARTALLEERIREQGDADALLALAAHQHAHAAGWITSLLEDAPLGALTSAALDLVDSWGESPPQPLVDARGGSPPQALVDSRDEWPPQAPLLALAHRTTASGSPAPSIQTRAIELIVRGYRSDTLPDALRRDLLSLLSAPEHVDAAAASVLFFLLDPVPGLDRLTRILGAEKARDRREAAGALVVIGGPEATAILRVAATREADVALALLRGEEPEPDPAPPRHTVDLPDGPLGFYTPGEMEASQLVRDVEFCVDDLRKRFGALLERWWAH